MHAPDLVGLASLTIRDRATLPDLLRRRVTLTGTAELHLTGEGDPLQNGVVNFASPEAWLFFDRVAPGEVSARLLGRMSVNGAAAAEDVNVRVARYGEGTVVIPHGPDYGAMLAFREASASGLPDTLRSYVRYGDPAGEPIHSEIRSFRLKRGYMATLAEEAGGGGFSKNYVAQDGDLQIDSLPPELSGKVRFVRIFPWRWTDKKGVAGNLWQRLGVGWFYNWSISTASTPDIEYVPIKQKVDWPDLAGQDWKARGAVHLLGYNEPDHKDQANLSVDAAIAGWPALLATGLRVGSPAVSDGGLKWLYEFMEKADAARLRVDFVAVHYYRAVPPQDAPAAARQLYRFLDEIHQRTRRPLWVTEWNNGANWTHQPEPSPEQQRDAIRAMVKILDETPFVERYAIYNWVKPSRAVVNKDELTLAGQVYRDDKPPLAYRRDRP